MQLYFNGRRCIPLWGDRREVGLVCFGGLDSEGCWRQIVSSSFRLDCLQYSGIPVRTNWPTVAEKPDKKALKGYRDKGQTSLRNGPWLLAKLT